MVFTCIGIITINCILIAPSHYLKDGKIPFMLEFPFAFILDLDL